MVRRAKVDLRKCTVRTVVLYEGARLVSLFPLTPRLLACIQEESLAAILVALEHTSAPWFPILVQLLAGTS